MTNVIDFPFPAGRSAAGVRSYATARDLRGNAVGPGPALTPRQARMVAVVATTFAATVYGDADALAGRAIESAEQGSLLATLPAVTWARGTGWRRQMARAFDDLAVDIAAGRDPEPTCAGEKMALRLVVAGAAEHAAAGDLDRVVADLPAHHRDGDWGIPADRLSDDGVMVDPEEWFVPFAADRSRDPDRGHRF